MPDLLETRNSIRNDKSYYGLNLTVCQFEDLS